MLSQELRSQVQYVDVLIIGSGPAGMAAAIAAPAVAATRRAAPTARAPAQRAAALRAAPTARAARRSRRPLLQRRRRGDEDGLAEGEACEP